MERWRSRSNINFINSRSWQRKEVRKEADHAQVSLLLGKVCGLDKGELVMNLFLAQIIIVRFEYVWRTRFYEC